NAGIIGAATTTIMSNTITGTTVAGIGVTGLSDNASMTVTDNTITGGQNGIGHNAGIIGAATTTIMSNTITGTTVAGIGVAGLSDNASMTVTDNTITGGQNGIGHNGGIVGTATTTITGNTITGQTGIAFNGVVSTTNANGVAINSNTGITGTTADAVAFNAAVTGAGVTLNDNTNVVGATNGVRFVSLDGATVETVGSTITGAMNGFMATASTTAGAESILTFANSAITGRAGAGLSVTTTAGGSGVTTDLGTDLTLTGNPALALSGPNQSLVGNTLSNTVFNSVNGGNFIELANGALFEPGRPTIIDGTTALFDGVQVPAGSEPFLVQSVESRIIDFDDADTLGQIFFDSLTFADVGDLPGLVSEFAFRTEGFTRVGNPQTPGDWILRPDVSFDIVFGDLLADRYGLGGCSPVLDADGAVTGFACIAPAGGSDISPFVVDFMADLSGRDR
ncbi:MAG: right-handed parallel beta-helix repeat-containing protein, partial [Pseudomonadota bacterium]